MRGLMNVKRNRTGDVHGDWVVTGPVAEDWRKSEYWHARNTKTGECRRVSGKAMHNLGKRTGEGASTI